MANAQVLDQMLDVHRSADIGWRPARDDFCGAATEAFLKWSASGSLSIGGD